VDGLNTPKSITNESARDIKEGKRLTLQGKSIKRPRAGLFIQERLDITRLMAGDVTI
jgi:hypothetical protein